MSKIYNKCIGLGANNRKLHFIEFKSENVTNIRKNFISYIYKDISIHKQQNLAIRASGNFKKEKKKKELMGNQTNCTRDP